MIADHGTKEAEKELERLADDLQRTYSEAQKDLQKKLESYTKKFEKEDAKRRELRDQGKITGQDYANWKMGQVFIGKQWQSKLDQMTQSLAHTNELALSIIRDGQMDVFAENANYFDYRIENDTGIAVSWGLYDEQTVISLIKDQPELMPRKNLDKGKDEAWNRTIIANCVTQSIIQGESINQLAKRVARDTASTNMKAMVRYARTAMTAAQNSGRIQAMNNAKDKGINVKKVWIATMDERTRHAHEQLDGQTQDINEPFDSELGAIMYPGDPSADEANVWNCRCALGYEYPDYPSYDYEEESGDDEEDYEEWEEEREERSKVVDGKDISGEWHRRESEFDFEIEDVMDAQGFDGLPQIVDRETFDKAVEDSGFIAQRTYSAPDQETLDAYRDQLYNGKWYVDCSTGGAQYGQGMYCAADYNGKLTNGIKEEMAHYQELGKGRTEAAAWEAQVKSMTSNDFNGSYYLHGKTVTEDEARVFTTLKSDGNLTIYKLSQEDRAIAEGLQRDGRWTSMSFVLEDKEDAFRFSYKGNYYTETFTLSPDAKIVKYNDVSFEKDAIVGKIRREAIDRAVKTGESVKEILRENKEYMQYRDMDVGAYAALKGYDAINAEGHGQSGSYTVILNRTKCIFLEGDYE